MNSVPSLDEMIAIAESQKIETENYSGDTSQREQVIEVENNPMFTTMQSNKTDKSKNKIEPLIKLKKVESLLR